MREGEKEGERGGEGSSSTRSVSRTGSGRHRIHTEHRTQRSGDIYIYWGSVALQRLLSTRLPVLGWGEGCREKGGGFGSHLTLASTLYSTDILIYIYTGVQERLGRDGRSRAGEISCSQQGLCAHI
jgi:hypothetical protein